MLKCSEEDWGSQLEIWVGYPDVDVNNLPRWRTNYDGFEVDEDFSNQWAWDFQPAIRHLTLQSAEHPSKP